MMKTSTLLALSIAGLAATAGLACYVLVSASDAPSTGGAGEKERAASSAPATEAITRILRVPEQGAAPSQPGEPLPPQSGKSTAARQAAAPTLVEPSDKAAREQSFSHLRGHQEGREEGTQGTQGTQGTPDAISSLASLTSLTSFKSELPAVSFTNEKTPAPSVPTIVKNKGDFANKTLPKERTGQTTTPPAPTPPQSAAPSRQLLPAQSDEASLLRTAPLPAQRRPWPRGNFTPEQERYRAQYGWQTFSEAIVAEAKEAIAQ